MTGFKRGTPFLQRVEVVESGCWLWRGFIDSDGYGLLVSHRLKVRQREAYARKQGAAS